MEEEERECVISDKVLKWNNPQISRVDPPPPPLLEQVTHNPLKSFLTQ